MKVFATTFLVAVLLTAVQASAAPLSAIPAYHWGEEVRGVYPAQVTAGSYGLSGGLQIAAPGDVTAAAYALYANSVGITRSQAPSPAGPYQVYLPDVAR